MTQQEFIRQLNLKPIKGLDGVIESVTEIAKNAFDAGFQEGMHTTIELHEKVSSLLNK